MKKYYCLIASFVLVGTLVSPGLASFTMPGLVYRLGQLSEAAQDARERDVPITFIYTNEATNCGLATAASLDVVEELKDYTVMVYINSIDDQDRKLIPDVVRRAIKSPQAGRFIPKAVVVDPDIKRVYSIVPYVDDVNERKANLRKVRSTFR